MKKKDGFILGILLALLFVFFHKTWLTNLTYFARDITYLFHPMHSFSAENLQAGNVPLWNPYISGGVYWLGQPQTGLFYPGNIFFWFFPFVFGFKLFHIFHLFLSALGGYLLTRSLGGRSRLALLMGLLWSLNGFWQGRLEFFSLFAVLAWIPWMFMLSRKLKGFFSIIMLSLVWALSLAAGHLPHVLWAGVLTVFWMVGFGKVREKIIGVAAAGIGALFLMAVQLGPFFDLLIRSDRVHRGIGLSQATSFSLSPFECLGLIFPYFSSMEAFSYTGEKFFWLGSFYIGLAGFVLAIYSFFQSKNKQRFLWAGIFIAGLLLALGEKTPLYPFLMESIPLFRWIRYPGQYTLWSLVACFVLIGSGISLINRWRPTIFWGFALFSLVELFVYGTGFRPIIHSSYFKSRPEWIRPLQETDKNGRLFFSPRAISHFSSEGNTDEETWRVLRHRLGSMATLPYHLRNLNPKGFSLNPSENERVLNDLYSTPSINEAFTQMSRLGVQWVVAPEPLNHPSLELIRTKPWNLYEQRNFTSGAFLQSEGDAFSWNVKFRGGNRIFLSGKVAKKGILYTGEIFYPGWRFFSEHREIKIYKDRGLMTSPVDGSVKYLWGVFRPLSFYLGVVMTLLGFFSVLGCLIWKVIFLKKERFISG